METCIADYVEAALETLITSLKNDNGRLNSISIALNGVDDDDRQIARHTKDIEKIKVTRERRLQLMIHYAKLVKKPYVTKDIIHYTSNSDYRAVYDSIINFIDDAFKKHHKANFGYVIFTEMEVLPNDVFDVLFDLVDWRIPSELVDEEGVKYCIGTMKAHPEMTIFLPPKQTLFRDDTCDIPFKVIAYPVHTLEN